MSSYPTNRSNVVLQWEKIRNEERAKEGNSEEFMEALDDEHVEVHVSEVDRGPYGIMISKDELGSKEG